MSIMGKYDASFANQNAMLAILTIFITLLLHSFSLKLERVLRRYKHLSEMLQHLYRELMVLGLISFGLFAVQPTDPATKHSFEELHILIFGIAIGYVVFTCLLMALSVLISQRWVRFEKEDHSDYLESKREFDAIREKKKAMYFFTRPFAVALHWRTLLLTEKVAFHDTRLHFLHSNHLPTTFSFARYLRKCKGHVLLQFGDIHSSCWMVLLIIIPVDMIVRNSLVPSMLLDDKSVTAYYQYLACTLAIILTSIPIAIFVKTRLILAEILCNSEMIDFDPIAARFYIDHWKEGELEAPEHSLSYTYEDEASIPSRPRAKHSVAHFTAESALRRVARTYQIDQWGMKAPVTEIVVDPSKDPDAVQDDEKVNDLAPTRLSRVQSVHNFEFSQMNLFWFNSHVFMLRMMQICLFLMACYCAALFKFSHILLGSPILSVVAILPPVTLLFFFSLTIPIYTIIIHVGQLVDLDIVLEARAKASNPNSKKCAELTSVSVASATLRRASTLMLINRVDRTRLQVSVFLFGNRFQLFLFWGILLHIAVLMMSYEQTLQALLPYLTMIIPTLFIIEMSGKLYAAGPSYFYKSGIVMFDLIVVITTFSLALAQLINSNISPILSAVVLLRLYQILRISRIGRIMRHQQEDELEAHLDQSDIDHQIALTKEKIMERIDSESRRKYSLPLQELPYSLGRCKSLQAPGQTRMRSLRINFGDGHVDVPVQETLLTPDHSPFL